MIGIGTARLANQRSWRTPAIVALLGLFSGGCKMGTAGTKPSWWAFGGTPKAESEALAAAPTFSGGVEKPSATAKPYPVTSTPNGYVIGDAKPDAAAPSLAATSPAAVTYGVTPPPARNDPVEMATAPTRPAATGGDAAAGGSMASIVPQVGAYSSLPAEPAATTSLPAPPPLVPEAAAVATAAATANAVSPPPLQAVTEPMPPQRIADTRAPSAWPDAPPAAAGPRYGSGATSRFGGAAAAGEAVPSSLPASLEPLPAAAAPAGPPAAAAMGGFPPPPTAVPTPVAAPAGLPPGGPEPASPIGPVRRRDPVYRPGGTTSYQPNRAILAGDAEPGVEPVRTVGFEEPVGESR